MNVAFLNSTYQLGGAETIVRGLIEGTAAAGHATRLYVAFGKTYPTDPGLVPLYPRVLSRFHHSRLRPYVERMAPRVAWTNRRVRTLASRWADLVHVHNFHGDYASVDALAALAGRTPMLWTLHGHWPITGGCDHPLDCTRFEEACGECPRVGVWPIGPVDDTARQLQHKVEHLGAVPLHVVAPSHFLAQRIARSTVGRHWRVHHIPNGVEPRTFSAARKDDSALRLALGLDPSATVILVVNRNFRDPEKGFPVVREALSAIESSGVRMQVVLAGQASEWAATALPGSLRPRSAGYVDSKERLASLYEAADIFLFASPAENFPCVILEAMASGCCVVATPTSGVTEQIQDGRTGVLADAIAGDALARALGSIAGDRGLQRRIGAAARERVGTAFPLDLMVRRYHQLYESLVA